ncbi:hypothetical protein GM547_14425, partial [Streptococcus pneumoniae]|uniref:Cro/CI family transcriptional regulator n=1 Tax=Streptococcus pneumoniae TaxID=1313 RepID=UPI0012D7AB1D|nr:hypothetical protein [Streptococcus pneumoniae]
MRKQFVISYFGTEAKTAEALGIKQPSVNGWADQLPYSAIGRIAEHQPSLLKK